MKITRNKLMRIIVEEMKHITEVGEDDKGSFDIDTYGTQISTSIKFVSSETPYDQTITKLQIMPHGEEFEDVTFYGSTVDDLADEVISYLEPNTSENYAYWFLDGDSEDFQQEFKRLIISALEELEIDPESDEEARTTYRDKEHNPQQELQELQMPDSWHQILGDCLKEKGQ
jgi:hypothetical protein